MIFPRISTQNMHSLIHWTRIQNMHTHRSPCRPRRPRRPPLLPSSLSMEYEYLLQQKSNLKHYYTYYSSVKLTQPRSEQIERHTWRRILTINIYLNTYGQNGQYMCVCMDCAGSLTSDLFMAHLDMPAPFQFNWIPYRLRRSVLWKCSLCALPPIGGVDQT